MLFTALIVGGGAFTWMYFNLKDLKTQIHQLEQQLPNIVNLENQTRQFQEQLSESREMNKLIKSPCIDSDVYEKPNDIYIKGKVVCSNEEEVETVYYDECSGSKTQVFEMWVYETPKGSGKYVAGKMGYDCPSGCFDGACVR
jgi:hypothetical protein